MHCFLTVYNFNILLNPLKCVFYITIDQLSRIIISQQVIMVDPSKFQAINEIPPSAPIAPVINHARKS